AKIPAEVNGSTIRTNVITGFAYRSPAAVITRRSIFSSATNSGSTMYGIASYVSAAITAKGVCRIVKFFDTNPMFRRNVRKMPSLERMNCHENARRSEERRGGKEGR